MPPMHRRKTPQVQIGPLAIGSNQPVRVQSMTDTPTADAGATLRQIKELVRAGSEMVRVTVNDDMAARALTAMIPQMRRQGINIPVIGDFHYNGHRLLSLFPELAQGLDKYRINPGNIGRGQKRDDHFTQFIKTAVKYHKPVRIGVNSGSLDQAVLADRMTHNARLKRPQPAEHVLRQAMVESALSSARYALRLGLPKNKIVLSVKMSNVQDTIKAYELLAQRCDLALHLGLTEAGSGTEGLVASTAALAVLLQQGIGDTIRVSVTPAPDQKRSVEVETCQSLLQSLGLRYFTPQVISCPGCGRTHSRDFQILALEVKKHITDNITQWRRECHDIGRLKIAVMGCVVNGPGESKQADIGISLPGRTERTAAVVYTDGKKIATLKGRDLKQQFLAILDHYIETFSRRSSAEKKGKP